MPDSFYDSYTIYNFDMARIDLYTVWADKQTDLGTGYRNDLSDSSVDTDTAYSIINSSEALQTNAQSEYTVCNGVYQPNPQLGTY